MIEEPQLPDGDDEVIELPGGRDPARVAADIAANRAHVERILNAPETPEERAAQAEYFRALEERASYGTVALSRRQSNVAQAQRRLSDCLHDLANLPADVANRELQEDALQFQVASCLFVLGDFKGALEWCPETYADHLAQYREFFDAELREDDITCLCSDSVTKAVLPGPNGKLYEQQIFDSAQMVLGEFPNARRKCWIVASRCLRCDDLVLRPTMTESAARAWSARQNTLPDAVAMADRGTCENC